MASEPRFNAWAALGTGADQAVQVVRNYDGRVFAMSIAEARHLAARIEAAADQAEARRR